MPRLCIIVKSWRKQETSQAWWTPPGAAEVWFTWKRGGYPMRLIPTDSNKCFCWWWALARWRSASRTSPRWSASETPWTWQWITTKFKGNLLRSLGFDFGLLCFVSYCLQVWPEQGEIDIDLPTDYLLQEEQEQAWRRPREWRGSTPSLRQSWWQCFNKRSLVQLHLEVKLPIIFQRK